MDTKEKRFESDIESYMLSQGGFTKGDISLNPAVNTSTAYKDLRNR